MPEIRAPGRAASLDGTLDLLPCGFASFDDDGTLVAVNSTLAALLGYERADLEGRHVETILTVAGRIFFQTHVYPLIRLHGRASELFVVLRRRDGGDVGALLNAERRERDGRAVTDCAIMEVRERRKFEDALLQAKQAAETASEALGERTRLLEGANDRLERQSLELELQHRLLQDTAVEVEAQSEELQVMNDELLSRTEELERARTAAEEANRAKGQFLAVMSHELRTPLNAIGGYAQLLELGIHGPVTAAQQEALGRIMRAQRLLLRLVNDVLNLARIESGRVEYAREDVPLAELVASVMPMVEPQMAAGGLTPDTSVAAGLVARADREKVQQILINLLTNAVKFTPDGGTVTVRATSDPGGDGVLVSVADDGPGIPAARLESIFEPFVQVDVGRTRREGTGLGLAISRDLARGMGGDLGVRSEEGRGSTFILRLPSAGS